MARFKCVEESILLGEETAAAPTQSGSVQSTFCFPHLEYVGVWNFENMSFFDADALCAWHWQKQSKRHDRRMTNSSD